MELRNDTFKNLIFISLTEIFGFITNFLIIYILSQIYPPSEFVYYPFSMTFLLFFIIFANFGLTTTIIQKLSVTKQNDVETIKNLISAGFKWELIFSFFISIIFYFLSPLLEQLYQMPGLSITLQFTSIYLFFFNLINYFECVFQGLLDFKSFMISNISFNILKLVIILINFNIKLPIYIIIALYSIFSFFHFIILLFYAQKKYLFLSKIFILNKNITKNLLNFSFFIFLQLFLSFLITNFNQLILGYFINSNELAFYYIAFLFMQLLNIPLFIFTRLIFPYISKYMKNNIQNKDIIEMIFNSIFKYGLLIMIPVSIFLFGYSDLLVIIIFGTEYYPASNYLRFYILFINIKMLNIAGESFLLGSNRQKLVFKLSAVASFFTFFLSIILIPIYLVYGAIIAAIVPHSIYIIISVFFVKTSNNIKFERKLYYSIIIYILSSVISLLISNIIVNLLEINLFQFLYILTFSGIFIIIFSLLIFILKAIKIIEIRNLIKTLKNF